MIFIFLFPFFYVLGAGPPVIGPGALTGSGARVRVSPERALGNGRRCRRGTHRADPRRRGGEPGRRPRPRWSETGTRGWAPVGAARARREWSRRRGRRTPGAATRGRGRDERVPGARQGVSPERGRARVRGPGHGGRARDVGPVATRGGGRGHGAATSSAGARGMGRPRQSRVARGERVRGTATGGRRCRQ